MFRLQSGMRCLTHTAAPTKRRGFFPPVVDGVVVAQRLLYSSSSSYSSVGSPTLATSMMSRKTTRGSGGGKGDEPQLLRSRGAASSQRRVQLMEKQDDNIPQHHHTSSAVAKQQRSVNDWTPTKEKKQRGITNATEWAVRKMIAELEGDEIRLEKKAQSEMTPMERVLDNGRKRQSQHNFQQLLSNMVRMTEGSHRSSGDGSDEWIRRKTIFSEVQKKVFAAVRGHHDPVSKALLLQQLHEKLVVPLNIRLRQDAYEDIFGVFAALALEEKILEVNMKEIQKDYAQAKSRTFARTQAPMLQTAWDMYQYMQQVGTKPTVDMIKSLMFMLSKTHFKKDVEVEAKAHALMMDAARFNIELDSKLLFRYFKVCAANNCMHIAVAYYSQYETRQKQQASGAMAEAVIDGLRANDQIEEALKFIQGMSNVPVHSGLVRSMMVVSIQAGQPQAVLSQYKAVFANSVGLRPTAPVFRQMVKACHAAEDFSPLPYILKEMSRYGVKATSRILGDIIVGLRSSGRDDLADRLLQKSRSRRVRRPPSLTE